MKMFGFELDCDDDPLELSEGHIEASPDEVRCIAAFLIVVADNMEQHGKDFSHQHFRDYAEDHGIRLDDTTADLIVMRRQTTRA